MDMLKHRFTVNLRSCIVSLLLGIVIGYLGGPAFALVWWALIGLVIGYFSASTKAGLVNGAVYGFALSYTFMLAGYSGSDPLASKLAPFVLFGMFGAVCGLCLGIIGHLMNRTRVN